MEEISSSVKEISGITTQPILDLFNQSQLQLENNVKTVLEQQQKNNIEVLKKIELLDLANKTNTPRFTSHQFKT